MESKLNKQALKEFSKSYSAAIGDDFFKDKSSIKGQEILNLSDIRQICLFIVYKILERWKEEASKLQSDYFNYETPQVKSALKEFMNKLSQHIEIDKEAFLPLLEKSTEETILLICSPYGFYTELVKRKDSVSVKEWKAFSKYVKINRDLYLSFVSKLENGGKDKYSTEEAIQLLNHLFEETSISPEDLDPYVQLFSKVVDFPLDKIYGAEEKKGKIIPAVKQAEYIMHSDEIKTLNDQLATDGTSLVEGMQKKKIESLKSHLSINQKFIFINQLFDGNSKDFNSVIDFLDNCPSQAEAMDFINNNYLKKNNWRKDTQEVKDFIGVIARKYS